MNLINCLKATPRFKLLRQVLIFLCVGGFATSLQYALMFVLIYAAEWDPVRASASGFIASSVVNFALNARFTFESEHSVLHTAPRFALVSAIGLSLNSAILSLLLSLKIHPLIGQIVATICVILWNYTINAIWTFKFKKA